MTANELRIGNYVMFSDLSNIFSITEISPTGLGVENENESTWIELEGFEPIPLTEEWLENFGFVRIGDIDDGMRYFHGVEIWKCVNLFLCNKNGILIKSVHQLQNLFFSLTGTELILNK